MNEINLIKQNNQVVVSSRQVAEHFGKQHGHVLRDIDGLLVGISKIGETPTFFKSTYIHLQNGQEYPEYLMNRDGFTLLTMGFNGKKALAWKFKYIQAFNAMEAQLRQPKTQLEILAESALILVEQEKQLKQLAAAQEAVKQEISETKQEIQDMRDIVALNPHEWRQETNKLIYKIAGKLGGTSFISSVRNFSYDELQSRLGVQLHSRLHNRKKRMSLAGSSAAVIQNTNYLDIIGDDKKLKAGYIAIVKEMAVRYSVNVS